MSYGAMWIWYTRLWRIAQEWQLAKPWYLELKHSYFQNRIFINTLVMLGFAVTGGDYYHPPAGSAPAEHGTLLSLRMRRSGAYHTAILTVGKNQVLGTWSSKGEGLPRSGWPNLKVQ